ncbi:nucleotidyltransferase family protein [Clostridium sp.]|uniref:nucleotidyltransferase family protein n=1 Tax=Clostridium sp. TaxID=1506 RepID=UPI001A521F6A|nr:nucleotidyltransferase family protein [Clostridium sp.]MBK5240788.1 nucleotidyltransferase family protein [Clostridium sp.]
MFNSVKFIVYEDVTIREGLKRIDEDAKGIIFVIDKDDKFLGTITDGDIRRWILKNGSMDSKVAEVMNSKSVFIFENDKQKAKEVMVEKFITAVPILNNDRKVIDIIFLHDDVNDENSSELANNSVVIMAGGLGTRLYPYTKILPKSLIPIGDTPIVERIINKFAKYGAKDFYLTVNHKKNMIKSYFNELDTEYNISYVEEEKPLGTGGSLSLLKGKINDTFFVSNCDILIDAQYDDILKYHKQSGNKVTVVTSVKNFTIPYGVFKVNEEGCIIEIQEKPEHSYLANTGMYVLEPEVLNDIPTGEFYNLPDILVNYMKDNIKVGIYPVGEQSWMDMGQLSEMKDMVTRIEEKEKSIK